MSLAYDFAGVFNQLVKPLVGIPQKEVDLNYDCPDSRDGFVLSSSASARAENSHGGTNVGRPSLLTANGHRDYKAGKKHSKDQQVPVLFHLLILCMVFSFNCSLAMPF